MQTIQAAQTPNRRSVPLIAAMAAVAVLCAAAVAGYIALQWGPQDPGIAACTSLAQLNQPAYLRPPDAPDAQTLRARFTRSRYGDLRDSGTHFIDLAVQLAPDTALTPWVAGQLLDSYARVAGACSSHGVPLPPLLGGTA